MILWYIDFHIGTNVPMISVFITNEVYVLESCTWQSVLDTTLSVQSNQSIVAVWWFSPLSKKKTAADNLLLN